MAFALSPPAALSVAAGGDARLQLGPACTSARSDPLDTASAPARLAWRFSIQRAEIRPKLRPAPSRTFRCARSLVVVRASSDGGKDEVKPLSEDPWFFKDPDADPAAEGVPLRFLRERKAGSHPRRRRHASHEGRQDFHRQREQRERRERQDRAARNGTRHWMEQAERGHQDGGRRRGPDRSWERERSSDPERRQARYPRPSRPASAPPSYGEDRGRSSREAAVNERIKQAGLRHDLAGIEAIVREHCPALNSINVSTAFYHIGKIVGSRRAALADARPALELLEGRFLELVGEFRPRALSNVLYGCALARHRSPPLLAAASRAAVLSAGHFDAQNCSNLLWSLATLRERDEAVFAAVAARSRAAIGSFNEQNLSNVAWACASLGLFDADLFDAIAAASVARVALFTPQGLATLAWSFATLRAAAGGLLLEAVAAHATSRLQDFAAQGLSLLCWSLATYSAACDGETPLGPSAAASSASSSPRPAGGAPSPPPTGASPTTLAFFEAAAGELLARPLSDFSPQAISNIVWAFAKVGVRDEAMLARVAVEAARRIADFGEQNISNVAWGFAKLQYAPPRLFAAISGEAGKRVHQLTGQGLANVAWAFATAKILDGGLFGALADDALGRLGALNCQQLANVAWAFGTMRVDNLPLMAALAAETRARGAAIKAQELTMVALAFAYVRFEEEAAIDGLVDEARRRLGEFSPQEVSNLAWALIAFGRHDAIAELGLLGRLEAYQRVALLSPENLNQLGIVLYAFSAERPDLLPRFPPALAAAVRAYHDQLVRSGGYESSGLHNAVAGELGAVRPGFVEEHFVGAYFLDIAYPAERLCVEVDGPLHYLALSGRLDGDSELKDRLLLRDGWTVHHVTYRAWNALPRPRRPAFLAALLEGRADAFLRAELSPDAPAALGPGPGTPALAGP